MASVQMDRDFHVQLSPAANATYRAGSTYHGVLENHARQIIKAGAGRRISPEVAPASNPNAKPSQTAKRRRRQA